MLVYVVCLAHASLATVAVLAKSSVHSQHVWSLAPSHYTSYEFCLLNYSGLLQEDPERARQQLAAIPARVVLYDELLDNSRRAYAEDLEEHKKIDRLSGIFDAIDDFAAAQVE